jgi:hypothetical protein
VQLRKLRPADQGSSRASKLRGQSTSTTRCRPALQRTAGGLSEAPVEVFAMPDELKTDGFDSPLTEEESVPILTVDPQLARYDVEILAG